jgi:vacuolar-type H+-ATPase subunit H
MNKKLIRLTEQDLHKIVKESVNRIIKENNQRARKIIREFDDYDEFEEEEFIDRKGNPIQKGSKVIWYDPERSARDLKRVWTVYDMGGDIVYIADDYGEAEVFPQELKVVG